MQYKMIQNINNGVVTGQKSMPQKDITSNGESPFQLGRISYVRSLFTTPLTLNEKQQKKWYQNRDASSVISKRKNNSIGNGSLNASGGAFSMTTIEDKNSQNSALRRVRAGGSVAPAKKANRPVLYDMPPGETTKQFVIQYKVDNVTLSELTDTQKTTLKNNAKTTLAQQLGISENDITVELIEGSVIYKFTIDSTNTDEDHETLKQNIENNNATLSNSVLTDIQTVTNDNNITLDSNYGGVVTEIDSNAEPEPEPVSSFFTDVNDVIYELNIEGTLSQNSYDGTVSGNNLKTVLLGTNVTSIDDEAFYQSNLESITISSTVTSLGYQSFRECSNLLSITIPDSVTDMNNRTFWDCSALHTVIIGNGLTTIGEYAFNKCDALVNFTMNNSVTTIKRSAFSSCKALQTMIIPDSVTSIDNYAFSSCTALQSVTIPNSVTSIEEYAFMNTGLQSVTIPDSVTRINNGTFYNCSQLQSVTIPDTVTSIDQRAFYQTSLQNVIIPNGVITIGDSAYYNCDSLETLTLGNSVTTINYRAFAFSNNLQSVFVSDSVTTIDGTAFQGTALTQVYMSETNNLGFSFGSNQSFYGTAGVTIIDIATYVPEPEPEPEP